MADWLRARQLRRHWIEETLVAAALTERPGQNGFPLAKKTGINAGRIYVVLARMEIAGRVESYWVDGPMRDRTRLYRLAAPPPTIVCLCGSTRFYDAFQQANYAETMAGRIVLSVGFYPHAKAEHGHGEGVGHDSAEKVALDELHKRKIDLADEILVLNVGGYVGNSTRSEIEYAQAHGKPIRWLEAPNV